MKKIIVAGAGHGGLSAAANLSKNGYDVTVFERRKEEELGYEWEDTFRRDTFDFAEIPNPKEEDVFDDGVYVFTNTSKTKKIYPKKDEEENVVAMERIVLIKHLISYCRECKVKFVFETELLSAICEGDRVTGVKIKENGEEKEVLCDLLIDSAGMDSPCRKSLPKKFKIANEISDAETFFVWRGYFKKKEEITAPQIGNIYFFHNGIPGMDWVNTRAEAFDVLVGGFRKIDEWDVLNALSDFRKEYPNMSEELCRGGRFEKIPLSKMMPLFVADGYAAVGDSAIMTEPLSGSGIYLSIKAGKLLADAVLESGGDTSARTLWNYNFKFHTMFSFGYLNDAVLKEFMRCISASDVDFLFEENFITAKELSKIDEKYTFSDIVDKLNVVKNPKLVLALVKVVKKFIDAELLKKSIPKEYDKEKVSQWVDKYNNL